MSEFLEFQGVSKRFGAIQAVDKVSLEIKKGEFFSLLGPDNGTRIRIREEIKTAK
jgi:ABC-type Fe3+/spermidine/putrescine transport system ATPase subunit